MQPDFLRAQVRRLMVAFPNDFDFKSYKVIHPIVHTESGLWFRELVDRMIETNDPTINIREEMKKERARRISGAKNG